MNADNTLDLRLSVRDPLIFRDARPFAFGQRMKSLPWLTPALVAGSMRSSLGKTAAQGADFGGELRQALQALHISTAFPCVNEKLYLPAPVDASATREQGPQRLHLQALHAGEGVYPSCNNPHCFLEQPSGKRVDLPAWWRFDQLAAWLAGQLKAQDIPYSSDLDKGFWCGPLSETRTHVGMTQSGVASDGQLFQTQGMVFVTPKSPGPNHIDLAVRMRWSADWASQNGNPQVQALQNVLNQAETWPRFVPVGGEHRAVFAQKTNPARGWDCPPILNEVLRHPPKSKSPQYVRMVLVSPACFAQGWRPDWLDSHGEGTPPSAPGLKLKLVAAKVPRWQAISGWSYAHRAPKRTHRVVPAGAVYFFQVLEGDTRKLASAWMQAVGDLTPAHQRPMHENSTPAQDHLNHDGFSLAVWGLAQLNT